MCGIAGVVRIHDPKDGPVPHHLEAIPEAWLDILDDSIKHRGPDGQGRFRDRAVRDDGTVVDVALVHRRLSILDHEGGHQPMVHDGEKLRPDLTYARGETPRLAHERAPGKDLVAVVFNGCVYNHRELRAELEGLGHVFGTDHSDTEVLVHGWREWGLILQDHIDAMYASMIWDRCTGQLATGVDNTGEKPHYGNAFSLLSPFAFVYSSSASGVLIHQAPATKTSDEFDLSQTMGLIRWIQDGASNIPAASIYNCSLHKWCVRPGLPLRGAKSDPRIELSRYADRSAGRLYKLPKRAKSGRRLTSVNKTKYSLEAAVSSRLEADVPLGVFLSGGLDSALIAAITHARRPDLNAFTVRMPDYRYDESNSAAETARTIGIGHTILDCEPNPAEDLVRLIEQLGLPFGDSSLLPTFWVSKAAREHVKVALSGDGGDELFGGYRRHAINPALHRWRHGIRLIPSVLLPQRNPTARTTMLARLSVAANHKGYCDLLSIFPTPDLRRLIPTFKGKRIGTDEFRQIVDPLRADFLSYLPADILRKTDTASMAVALEVRAPFLAKELVEAAMRTPLDVLMPKGERKGLLKRIAREYLPDHIVDRPKQGFAIPIGEWFRSDYGGMRQLLLDHIRSSDPFPGLGEAGVEIDMSFVERMLREHDAAGEKSINPWHGRDHSQRLYMLLVLSIWARWLDGVRRSGANVVDS